MCNCKFNCTLTAIVASLIAGVAATLLAVTSTLILTPVFLWVILGTGLGLTAIAFAGAIFGCNSAIYGCCFPLNALLVGAVGSILGAAVLLLTDLAATGIVSALISGAAVFFFTLAITSVACFVKCVSGCSES